MPAQYLYKDFARLNFNYSASNGNGQQSMNLNGSGAYAYYVRASARLDWRWFHGMLRGGLDPATL